jgi:alkylated DNA repair dioxygenase AlkB
MIKNLALNTKQEKLEQDAFVGPPVISLSKLLNCVFQMGHIATATIFARRQQK